MQELISEVQLPEKKRKALTSLLHNLNDAVTSLPDEKIKYVSSVISCFHPHYILCVPEKVGPEKIPTDMVLYKMCFK